MHLAHQCGSCEVEISAEKIYQKAKRVNSKYEFMCFQCGKPISPKVKAKVGDSATETVDLWHPATLRAHLEDLF